MIALLLLGLALVVSQNPPPKGTFDDANKSNTPQFQSVGVRGTIDAGGYGAAANEKSQNEFYEQLTNLQIGLLRSAWAPQEPCPGSNAVRSSAISLMGRGEFTAAIDSLEKLLRTNNDPATHQLLGLAYEAVGQLAAATEQLRIAFVAEPTDDAAAAAYGVALLLDGDADRAETVCRRAFDENGSEDKNPARLCLGAALSQKGRGQEAFPLFLDAAKFQPSEFAPFGFIALAVRWADPVTLAHSLEVLYSMAHAAPGNGNIPYAVACALAAVSSGGPDRQQADEIKAELEQAVALSPSLADAHFRLAAIFGERENLPAAIAEYQAALKYNPRLIEAHYHLSQLYNRTEQTQRAKEELALHQHLRMLQKSDIEKAKVPVSFGAAPRPCL